MSVIAKEPANELEDVYEEYLQKQQTNQKAFENFQKSTNTKKEMEKPLAEESLENEEKQLNSSIKTAMPRNMINLENVILLEEKLRKINENIVKLENVATL